jgi:hypothetical protein
MAPNAGGDLDAGAFYSAAATTAALAAASSALTSGSDASALQSVDPTPRPAPAAAGGSDRPADEPQGVADSGPAGAAAEEQQQPLSAKAEDEPEAQLSEERSATGAAAPAERKRTAGSDGEDGAIQAEGREAAGGPQAEGSGQQGEGVAASREEDAQPGPVDALDWAAVPVDVPTLPLERAAAAAAAVRVGEREGPVAGNAAASPGRNKTVILESEKALMKGLERCAPCFPLARP